MFVPSVQEKFHLYLQNFELESWWSEIFQENMIGNIADKHRYKNFDVVYQWPKDLLSIKQFKRMLFLYLWKD